MGAKGDIISRGIPGITSRAHRSPHKLTLSPACRLAPAPRRTISSIFLLSSLISSASLPAGSRFVLARGRMWLWRSGCHPLSRAVSLSARREWGFVPNSPNLGCSSSEPGDSRFGDSVREEKRLTGWFCPQNEAFLSILSLM